MVGFGTNCEVEHIMTNNFALGGLNTSLVFRRVDSGA
jgi:3-oxoacyl-(acyl-carrier-protein) synthase